MRHFVNKHFYITVIFSVVLIVGFLTGLVLLNNHFNHPIPMQTHNVNAIINGLVYIPDHYVGIPGKGGHDVPDEWDVHFIYFEDGVDKIIVKQVTQQEFNAYKRGQELIISVP